MRTETLNEISGKIKCDRKQSERALLVVVEMVQMEVEHLSLQVS